MLPVAVYRGEKNISGEKVAQALRRLGVAFQFIGRDEIVRGRLSHFACVIFPGGHSVRIGGLGETKIKRFVRAGGGFVGICAGAQFGVKLGLLPVHWKALRAVGVFDMRVVAKHAVVEDYRVAGKFHGRRWTYSNTGRVRMRYANGGVLEARPPARIIVGFDEYGELGAVVAGKCGQGRVVLITPHPESTPPADEKHPSDADRSQDPFRLFANAVQYAARRT